MKKNDSLDPVDALIEEGAQAMEDEDFEAAVECFRQALKQAPFRQDIKALLARALEQKPAETIQITKAKERRRKIRRKTAPRKTGIKIGIWLLIFSFLCLSSLAFFFFFSSAIQSFVSNIARPKEEARITAEDREAAALYKSAELLQQQKRFSEAIDSINQAIDKNPTNLKHFEDKLAELYFEKGEALYKKDDYVDAIKSYEKAVEYNPESTEYYYSLGWAHYIQGRKNQNRRRHTSARNNFNGALEAFLKILERDTDDIRTKSSMAKVYIARNEASKAAEMYQQIIRQAPDSRDAERAKRALKSMGFRQ